MGRTNDRARERRGERERESRRGLPKERWRDMERWHDMARAKQILKIIPRHSMYAIYAYIDPLAPPQLISKYTIHGVFGDVWGSERYTPWNPPGYDRDRKTRMTVTIDQSQVVKLTPRDESPGSGRLLHFLTVSYWNLPSCPLPAHILRR